METTPYFLWAPQPSSSAAASASHVAGFGAPEESVLGTTAAEMAALVSPQFTESVARPRLRRQSSSGSGKKPAGSTKKQPQRGLGVAELERLRCGRDPLLDLNAAAAVAMGDAAANAQGHPVQHQLPAFDATTGLRYYSPLVVQPSPPPPAPPSPFCYAPSPPAGGQSLVPEQPYFLDRCGRVGGFAPAGNLGTGHLPQLLAPAPEHPSSQSIWRPVSITSSSSCCLHSGRDCNLCSRKMRDMTERGSRTAAAATTATAMPDYSIFDLAAAMAATCKDKGDEFLARQGKKEVREIEFFPTSTKHAGGVVVPSKSEYGTIGIKGSTPISSSGGASTATLDLSLKL